MTMHPTRKVSRSFACFIPLHRRAARLAPRTQYQLDYVVNALVQLDRGEDRGGRRRASWRHPAA